MYFRYLAHMYMAEALVALDKIADAVQELQPDQLTDVSVPSPVAQSETAASGQEAQADKQTDGNAAFPLTTDQGQCIQPIVRRCRLANRQMETRPSL